MHVQNAFWVRSGIAFITIGVMSAPAQAQMTRETVQVGGRVASFLQPSLSGPITVAIVYEPGDDTSEREAQSIEREIGSGLRAGALVLRPRRVASNALGELGGARIAFVTRGINYRQIATVAAARSILTISSDAACTRAGLCAVAIQAAPRVQIIVSRAACIAARIKFSAAFLMLVREI